MQSPMHLNDRKIIHKTHTSTHTSQCMNRKTLQYWGIKQYTQTEVTANRPDMRIKNKEKKKTCILIDVAIPADRNAVRNEADKKLKHTSL